ncbi:MAG: phosphate acyltransferase PlsX [Acidimicrobiales bacterium]
MKPIGVDVMGGDKAPAEIVAGCVRASRELGIDVLLVGRPDALEGLDTGGLEVVPASEVIEMAEDPAMAVRTKKDSSLVRLAEAVRDGRASAMVSAGNTGATMASALLRTKRIRGVIRPAIVTPIPVPGGATPTALLDAGANVECTGEMLVQFAHMGSAYFTARYGVAEPRVGLLSIGEEPGKGGPLRKEAHALLSAEPGLNFLGNVEGRDVMSEEIDVCVTDGFTGNVTLKALEGGMRALSKAIMGILLGTDEARAASEPLLPAFGELAAELDPESHGGAMLLGTDGLCIISHGSSSATAIVNAVRTARDMVEADLVGAIRRAIRPGSAPEV